MSKEFQRKTERAVEIQSKKTEKDKIRELNEENNNANRLRRFWFFCGRQRPLYIGANGSLTWKIKSVPYKENMTNFDFIFNNLNEFKTENGVIFDTL